MRFIFEPFVFENKAKGEKYYAVRVSLIDKDNNVLKHSYKPVMYITEEQYKELISK